MARTPASVPTTPDTRPPAPDSPVIVRTSEALADWEKDELDEIAAETPAPAPDPTPYADMTPEEADTLLAQLTEFGGRLPLKIRRRDQSETEYYVRPMKEKESRFCEAMYVARLHALRKQGVPSTPEFIQELMENNLTQAQRDRITVLEGEKLPPMQKNLRLMEVFMETPYMGLVNNTADVMAQREHNVQMVAYCVERRIETEGETRFKAVWKNADEVLEEDADIVTSAILGCHEAHARLVNVRFLSPSSAKVDGGDTKSESPKSMD